MPTPRRRPFWVRVLIRCGRAARLLVMMFVALGPAPPPPPPPPPRRIEARAEVQDESEDDAR